jgi:hypothetical protein
MAIWNILPSFGIFYDHLEYCTIIWYILRPFGNVVVICVILVYCVKKNLATLVGMSGLAASERQASFLQ